MCLNVCTYKQNNPYRQWGRPCEGYKIVRRSDVKGRAYKGVFRSSPVVKLNEWCDLDVSESPGARNAPLHVHDSPSKYRAYQRGFHLFGTLQNAVQFVFTLFPEVERGELVLVKVAYRRVCAVGRQCGAECIVAREMKILREIPMEKVKE